MKMTPGHATTIKAFLASQGTRNCNGNCEVGLCCNGHPGPRNKQLQEGATRCAIRTKEAPRWLAQVYDGSRVNWREDEAGSPVNAYGKSKLEAERVIQVGLWTG